MKSIINISLIALLSNFGFSQFDSSLTSFENKTYYIHEDCFSQIWLAQNDRIVRIIGSTEINYRKNSSGLKEVLLQSEFFDDSNGNVWFSTNNYIVKYDRKNDRFQNFRINNDTISNYRLFRVNQNGNILLQAGKSLFEFNPENLDFKLIHNPIECIDYQILGDTKNNSFSIIGTRWAYGNGAVHLEVSDGKISSIDTILNDRITFRGVTIQNYYLCKGNLGLTKWKKDEPPKMLTFNGDKLKFGDVIGDSEVLVFSDNALYSFNVEKNIYSFLLYLEEKVERLIKLESGGYLGILKNGKVRFIKPKRNDNWSIIITDKMVSTLRLLSDDFNGILFNLKNGALKRYNNRTNDIETIKNWNYNSFFSINNGKDFGIATAREHIRYKATNRNFSVKINHNVQNLEGVFDLENGEHCYFTNNGILLTQKDSVEVNRILEGNFLSQPYISNTNNIFVAGDSEILIFDIYSDSIKLIERIPFKNSIHQFIDYQDSLLLIATDQGIKKLDLKTTSISGNILSNEFIAVLSIDLNQNIWAGSGSGIFKITPSNVIRFYERNNTISGVDFSLNCSAKDTDGNLYFGTNKGILYFHPDSIKDINFNPPMMLTSLKIHGHEWADDTLNIEVLDQIPPLDYNQNTLTFDFVAIDYDPNNHPQYSVYLEGYDVDTTTLGDQSYITYPNLQPGNYRFHYSSCTLSGYCRDEFKTFEFEIAPPYWETWWFRSLAILAILGIVATAIGLYLRNRLREQRFEFEKQQLVLKTELQLQQERNRIADELHDELGGKLSSIKFAGKKVQKATHIDDVKKITNRVSEISTELIESMRSIIWAMDTQNDTLSSLQANVRSYASTIGKDNDLKMKFDFQESEKEIIVKGQIRHHLFLTIKEILNNIIKHSDATEVEIAIAMKNNKLHTSISENGMGFTRDEISNYGKGIKSIDKRMKTIDSKITYDKAERMNISIATPL